jgi:hypothetical protein
VFLNLKCVIILIMSVTRNCFELHFFKSIYLLAGKIWNTVCMQLVGKVHNVKYHVCKKHTVPLQFSFSNVTFPSILQLLLKFFGAVLEVMRAMRIHSVVCVITLHSLVHGYEWFGGACWVSSQAICRWRHFLNLNMLHCVTVYY